MKIVEGSAVHMGRAVSLLPELLPKGRVIVITDSNVDRCHHALISSYEHIVIGLGETAKCFATLERVYTALMDMDADRSTFLLGIGGGIVTDITGFVATTYMRGINFGFIPTTLLAAVDASVGGKNGVNVGGYKNMVGTFSQPQFVICDMTLFNSLSDREFRAGIAEIIKAAVIADVPLFERLESLDFQSLRTDVACLAEIVQSALKVKIDIVAADVTEKGLRRVLNLGHTIAHAIEKNSKKYNHGEAVAVGLCVVADVAAKQGMLPLSDAERIKALCLKYGFDISLPETVVQLLKAVRRDKKREGDTIHLIMPVAIGQVVDNRMSFSAVEGLFAD